MRLSAPAVREIVARFDTDGDDQVDFSALVAFFFHQKDTADAVSQRQQQPRHWPVWECRGQAWRQWWDIWARLSQVISVEQELRAFFDLFTGRNKASIANENKIICAVVNFAMEVNVGHAGWRYSAPIDGSLLNCFWILCAKSCLRRIHRSLLQNLAPEARDLCLNSQKLKKMRAVCSWRPCWRIGPPALPHDSVDHARIDSIQTDEPSADDNKGDDARREGGLLPVDFAQGLHRPNFLSVSEIEAY